MRPALSMKYALLLSLSLGLACADPAESLAPNDELDDASLDPIDPDEPDDESSATEEALAGPLDASKDHRPFVVMSYNLRGPVDSGAHSWDHRRASLITLVKKRDPDVLGVQEAMVRGGENMPADLINGLKGSYDYYTYNSTTPKLIFYRRGRFTRLSAGTVSLPNPYSSKQACFDRSKGKKLVWVKLRDASTGKQYFIGNTHLAFSSSCGLGRLKQAQAIKAAIDRLSGDLPVVVMGDFNTDDQSPDGKDEGVAEAMETDRRNLFRTARHDGKTGPDDATFNTRWNGRGTNQHRFDYIFHSGGELTSGTPIVDRSGADTHTPSDHFPILATIRPAPFAPASILAQVKDGERADTQLFFADVDGDGCVDQLSWAASLGETWWSKSRCDGTFTAPVQLSGASSGVDSTRFSFADVTGDGCAEKIYWRPTFADGAVRVYRGRCNGTFDAVVELSVTRSESENTRFFFARVTQDKCADLIRWNPGQNAGRLTVYPSACDSTVSFGAGVVSSEGATEAGATDLWFADVDGDGRDDEIAWLPDVAGGRTRVYRALADGRFDKLFEHTAGSSGVEASRFFFADVDGDRRADKIFWRPGFRQGRAQIYLSTGSNFAGSPIMDNGAYSSSADTRFFYADVDQSGAADKIYWNPGANGGASKVYRSRR
ncbi:MAG: endonuclease/exonuclease/phosphatase family protein [Archangiaceae bacterium]|nr:endonuclease/exonuclease/phosphatase family protein [Archangiaceae bacterium]